ncbi:hypothetical protein VBD025_14515 [Virgibacillus flavescens]|uniref:hypothetical protein n=1 Tax=Virgibacillus flavescens TaxID=1611422 RepID=UPI003D337F38
MMNNKATVSVVGIILFAVFTAVFLEDKAKSDQSEIEAVDTSVNQELVHPLFSDNADYYSLLVAEAENIDQREWMKENNINNVNTIHGRSSVHSVNAEYPFLDLEKAPAFVLFNRQGIVYKTYKEKDVIQYLKSHDPS